MPRLARRPLLRPTALALACAAAGSSASAVHAAETLQQWRAYAGEGMRPAFSWSGATEVSAPTLLSEFRRGNARIAGDPSAAASIWASLSFEVLRAPVGAPSAAVATPQLDAARSQIASEFASTAFSRPLTWGEYDVAAVVARQRYASLGFGTAEWSSREDVTGLYGARPDEVASGYGVRLGFQAPLGDQLQWRVGYQSRLDMDSFESFRGVDAEAADFDSPARAVTQLAWSVSSAMTLAVGVERVFYGDIDAFSSAALPTRFLSLLGDGSSPEFAWRDLTVYSAEGQVADAAGGEWTLRYTTRQQPSPTSDLLRRALEPEFTDTNLALAYRRALRGFGQISLAASYAPSRYFLGASTYVPRDARGEQVEFEALWSLPF